MELLYFHVSHPCTDVRGIPDDVYALDNTYEYTYHLLIICRLIQKKLKWGYIQWYIHSSLQWYPPCHLLLVQFDNIIRVHSTKKKPSDTRMSRFWRPFHPFPHQYWYDMIVIYSNSLHPGHRHNIKT